MYIYSILIINRIRLYDNVTKRYQAVCIVLEFQVLVATSMVTLPGFVLTEKNSDIIQPFRSQGRTIRYIGGPRVCVGCNLFFLPPKENNLFFGD